MQSTAKHDVEVRAWDLGGYGDIAGAMRTASHIRYGGLETAIIPTSSGALGKLMTLSPDVPISAKRSSAMQVDVAGHYYDTRTKQDTGLVPHIYAEDMDNYQYRGNVVPIYIKTGLVPVGSQVSIELSGSSQNPMFYRPFREWELPEPGKRDVKSLLMQAAGSKNPNGLQKILDATDSIAFGHLNPYGGYGFLNSSYVQALNAAAENFDGKFALGLFFNKQAEDETAGLAINQGYTIYRSNGEVISGDPSKSALIFLGPQPQLMTSSLFVSATMPNIVTGDLSLSDALYALIAMEGQGFFYDCPSWKLPTFREMGRILSVSDGYLAQIFQNGSMIAGQNNPIDVKVAAVRLGNKNMSEEYRAAMRDAVLAEIERRFGMVHVNTGKDGQGLYVPRGAPFLFQDAVETVLHALANSPTLLEKVEDKRVRLATGAREPVVTISGNVMAPEAPININLIPYLESKIISNYSNKSKIYDTYLPKIINEILEPYSKKNFKIPITKNIIPEYESIQFSAIQIYNFTHKTSLDWSMSQFGPENPQDQSTSDDKDGDILGYLSTSLPKNSKIITKNPKKLPTTI